MEYIPMHPEFPVGFILSYSREWKHLQLTSRPPSHTWCRDLGPLSGMYTLMTATLFVTCLISLQPTGQDVTCSPILAVLLQLLFQI